MNQISRIGLPTIEQVIGHFLWLMMDRKWILLLLKWCVALYVIMMITSLLKITHEDMLEWYHLTSTMRLTPLRSMWALNTLKNLSNGMSNSYKRKLKKVGIRHPRRGSIQPLYLSFNFFGFVRPYNKQDLVQQAFLEDLCYTLLKVIVHCQLLKMHLASQITLYYTNVARLYSFLNIDWWIRLYLTSLPKTWTSLWTCSMQYLHNNIWLVDVT
jgi:hypothetical protein